jgi:hypothetical protein
MVAPVVEFDSLHLFLSIVAVNDLILQQLDVKATFMYGELKETIYMRRPESYKNGNKVARLKTCI